MTASSPRLYLSAPHMGSRERELLLDAFDSNWIAPLGPHVDAFEREFAAISGRQHAVAVSSGTAALHLCLRLLDVQPGDDIVTSSLTFVATANSIRYANAKPVFLDSDEETWNMDPALLAEELDRRSRQNRLPAAVMVVDVNGQCANYTRISEICETHNVPIIEDAAESLGASLNGKPAGSFGELSCFSFNGNKIITTSGGGMLVTDNEAWAKQARYLATQARDPAPHYEHSVTGYNYRMSNLLAAIGRGQLQVLADRVDRRREIFALYRETLGELPGVQFMPEPDGFHSTRWLTALTIDAGRFGADREQVRLALEEANIESRPVWKPMHMQPAFADCEMIGGKVCERLFRDGLCLPSGSSMSQADQDRVIKIVRSQCSAVTPTISA
ncbi:DegT/DnrJ/EryC1/StrS family aminotransferase [Allorhodopirellula solitaria]|uniref:GDP-perosamine synthase n=1 Tax=Allorhodopirellula solitaria TaxID=2527987 RepID=A0A5C5XRP2_9BACT|nr:aminotransferase class I/II-fold pyridoxal phosphate-dependent enzyme [Allorhodopirellula solitaria]TWT65043.1 putative pyridoxal phosphate-dependent aminotransferase EpsN [Allorhodopirellula solitaria]